MPTPDDETALGPAEEVDRSAGQAESPLDLGLRRVDRKRVFAALFEDAKSEPETFGRFRVVCRLGRGGMGTVLEAYDPQLDRTVAIKVLHERADDERQQRLMREAQALARLSHPNVVQVFETGEANDRPFVAMELVRGHTLRKWHQQPHPWQVCLDVYQQAARGLAAAHAVKIVHRDFKPTNCIIDDAGRVRVLDFGLARGGANLDGPEQAESRHDRESQLTTAQSTDPPTNDSGSTSSARMLDQQLTQTGTLLGTPAYMAPEQARRAPTDARSDQFSFCVALYEALYGSRPFDGLSELLESCDGKRPDFETAASHASLPRVPAWLRRVLARGLEARPEDRFASMDALLDTIAGHLRARRRRTVALAVGVGLVAVATLVGVGVGVVTAVREARQQAQCDALGGSIDAHWNEQSRQRIAEAFARSDAPDPKGAWARVEPRLDVWAHAWREARTTACHEASDQPEQERQRATCLEQERWEFEAMLDVLDTADRTTVLEAVMAVSDLPEVARCSDLAWLAADISLHSTDPEVETQSVALRRDLARVLALERTSRYDEALALALASVESSRSLGDPVAEAEALAKLGAIRWRMADFAGAEQALLAGHFLAGRVEHDRVAYTTARDLAWVVGVRLTRLSEGRVWLEHARTNLVRTGGDPEHDPELLVMLGELESADDNPAKALTAHEQALALRQQVLGAEHPEVADSLINLGRIQGALGDERALATLERGRAIAEATLGSAHPVVANADNELAVLLVRRGRAEEGIAAYRRAVATRERALGPDDPGLATMLSNLAAALDEHGAVRESSSLLRRAVGILEHGLGPDHPDTLVATINLAVVEAELGEIDEAITRLREAHRRAERVLGPGHPLVAVALAHLAYSLEQGGDHAGALPLRRRVVELDEALLGPDHLEVAADLDALALANLRVDDAERALANAQRAFAIRDRLLPPEDLALARSLDGLALALLALDRVDEALTQHSRAIAIRGAAGQDVGDPADMSALQAKLARLRPAVPSLPAP